MEVARCRITGNAGFSYQGAPVIARNGRIQRFSYNCSTQYSRVNLRRTGFFGPLHPEGPVASPWPSPSSVSSSTSRTSVTSLGSTVNNPPSLLACAYIKFSLLLRRGNFTINS